MNHKIPLWFITIISLGIYPLLVWIFYGITPKELFTQITSNKN